MLSDNEINGFIDTLFLEISTPDRLRLIQPPPTQPPRMIDEVSLKQLVLCMAIAIRSRKPDFGSRGANYYFGSQVITFWPGWGQTRFFVTGLFFIALWESSRYDRLSSIFRLVVILKMSARKKSLTVYFFNLI